MQPSMRSVLSESWSALWSCPGGFWPLPQPVWAAPGCCMALVQDFPLLTPVMEPMLLNSCSFIFLIPTYSWWSSFSYNTWDVLFFPHVQFECRLLVLKLFLPRILKAFSCWILVSMLLLSSLMPFKFLILFYDLVFFSLEAFILGVLKCHKDVPLFFYCLDTLYALQSEGSCLSVLGRFLVLFLW